MMKLYPHQIKALEQTKQFDHVGYFLDMGLGKTFVGAEKMVKLNRRINLLVCQKSKINDWINHFKSNYEWTVYDLTKNLSAFIEKIDESHPEDRLIGVINYELAWRRSQLLSLREFTLMLDESSLIQNTKAKQTKFILKLNPANVILLSGTPTSGKYENIWSQCHLLGWEIPEKTFLEQYINWKKIQVGKDRRNVVDRSDPYKNTDRMKQKMNEHGCIWMKTNEVIDLPEQIFIPVMIQASKNYRKFTKDKIVDVGEEILVGDTLLTKRLCERKLCGMYSEGKLEAFKDLIQSTNDRLIVFYNFNNELFKLKRICEQCEKPISIINGEFKDLNAYELMDDSVTLVQYQAGAYGLNLQKANKIIYFTISDKSELFEQSQKRIHRIGQNQTCFYYLMMVMNSVETNEILPTLQIRKEFTDELFRKEKSK